MPIPTPVNLAAELGQVTELWSPRVVAAPNGQFLKVARVRGEFVWHQHDAEDELFLVLRGRLRIRFEEGDILLSEGDCVTVPRGVRHCPVADDECWIALFEPQATSHTGEVVSDRSRSIADQTAHLQG